MSIQHFRKALDEAKQEVCDLFIRDMMQCLVSQGFSLKMVLTSFVDYTDNNANLAKVNSLLREGILDLQQSKIKND